MTDWREALISDLTQLFTWDIPLYRTHHYIWMLKKPEQKYFITIIQLSRNEVKLRSLLMQYDIRSLLVSNTCNV